MDHARKIFKAPGLPCSTIVRQEHSQATPKREERSLEVVYAAACLIKAFHPAVERRVIEMMQTFHQSKDLQGAFPTNSVELVNTFTLPVALPPT